MKGTTWMKWAAAALCVTAAVVFSGCGGTGGASSAAQGEKGKVKIVVGTSGQEANWNQMAEEGKGTQGVDGFAIDLWNEIAKRNGWDIEYRIAEFSALWGMMDNDAIDSVAGNISITDERKTKYDFSNPFYMDNSVFVYKPSLGKPADVQFFKGMTVGVAAPDSSKLVLEAMDKEYGLGLNMINLDRGADVVPNVISGVSQAGFIDKSMANIAIYNIKADLVTFDPHYRVMGSACPFKKNDRGAMLLAGANKAIHDMKQDGTLKKISEKWLHDDMKTMPEEFWEQ